jgi:uncharacterized RDD family membrane protein YckC
MNLETNSIKKSPPTAVVSDEFDFDFKPITSGLGFHQQHTTEIKPAFKDHPISVSIPHPSRSPLNQSQRHESQIYQNDISLFYNLEASDTRPVKEEKVEKNFKAADKSQRIIAYVLDFGFLVSILSLVLTMMSGLIETDLIDLWSTYPNEITPLVITLFCGFYLIYFSIFEKTNSSTLGKSMLRLQVVNLEGQSLPFSLLLLRSLISLSNFISLGLFSYFDLQSKVSGTKVIKVD